MPEVILKTKFYVFRQNNSGGKFYQNEDVGHYVFIEALDYKHANAIFSDLNSYKENWCECCGKRWDYLYDESDSIEEIGFYDYTKKSLIKIEDIKQHSDFRYFNGNRIIAHYLNKSKQEFIIGDKNV